MALVLAANFELPALNGKTKYTAYDHFYGNGLYGKILTNKEPITACSDLPQDCLAIK